MEVGRCEKSEIPRAKGQKWCERYGYGMILPWSSGVTILFPIPETIFPSFNGSNPTKPSFPLYFTLLTEESSTRSKNMTCEGCVKALQDSCMDEENPMIIENWLVSPRSFFQWWFRSLCGKWRRWSHRSVKSRFHTQHNSGKKTPAASLRLHH